MIPLIFLLRTFITAAIFAVLIHGQIVSIGLFEKLGQDPEVYNTMWGPSEFHCTGRLQNWNIERSTWRNSHSNADPFG